MSWRTKMTKQGLSVLAGLDGRNVKIVSAWAGSGRVDGSVLGEQTGLAEPRNQMAVIEDYSIENKRFLRLQIWSKNVETAFKLTELGVYVQMYTFAPLLYVIAQLDDGGDAIPSCKTTASFIAEYLITLTFADDADVTIEVSETGFITPDALDARLKRFAEQFGGSLTTDLPGLGAPSIRLFLRHIRRGLPWVSPEAEEEAVPIPAALELENGEIVKGMARLDSGEIKELQVISEKDVGVLV